MSYESRMIAELGSHAANEAAASIMRVIDTVPPQLRNAAFLVCVAKLHALWKFDEVFEAEIADYRKQFDKLILEKERFNG